MNVYQFCECSFPFGFEGGMWDLIVLLPDHCLSIYFSRSLDDHLNIDNPYFEGLVDRINPPELQINLFPVTKIHSWICMYLFRTV